jgi:predicted nucleic acid-binding protein
VLIHTAKYAHAAGVDPVTFLTASGLRIHPPDEAIARRVARLETSLADGFAAATAQELGARLHTTDRELVRQLRQVRLAITHY